jgi:ribonuclease HII
MSQKKNADKSPQKAATAVSSKEKDKEDLSRERLQRLLAFDREVLIGGSLKKPAEFIIGTDEVGRGCLAGPVVACAVMLPCIHPESDLFADLVRLNDSKQVPPDVREKLAATLRGHCQFAIAEASVEEIDEINILHASLLAMKRAVRKLKVTGQAVILIDGNKTISSIKNIEQITVIDGDNKSASIAAASIIAKVHRDAFMRKLAKKFPVYKWDSNKGYRSPEHYAALNQFGMTDWHRKSFNCGVNREVEDDELEAEEQLKLDLI